MDVWRRPLTQDATISAKHWTAGSVLQKNSEGKDPSHYSLCISFSPYIALHTIMLSFRNHVGLSVFR